MIHKYVPASLVGKVGSIFRQWDGALTRDTVLESSTLGLGKLPERLLPDETTTMTCGYCATGCGLEIHLKESKAINLTATADYPVNIGQACPKGWEALTPLAAPDRATTPYLRDDSGTLQPVTWAKALETFVDRFKQIQDKYGRESVAFLSTGQIPMEEMALLGAVAKFGMGMVHGDGNTRQCMATAVVAYKQSFGFDAPPYTYRDFEESDVIVFVGANPCVAHPIMWGRVCLNQNKPEIIVVDPRRTETAVAATQHYALAPKSDLALFYGLAHILIANGWIDRPFIDRYTTGFDDFAAHVEAFTPELVSERSGLSVEQLYEFAETIHKGQKVSFWWTMGVNQSYEGVRTAQALINLALMTGNIGRPGTGANSITGQCNAMGSRLFSNTTNLLGGHDFLKAADREKVANVLGIDPAVIPDQNSWPYPKIIEGVKNGQIKGLWIIATNPAHSWINQGELHELLDQLEFLVVQDMYHTTETAQVADLVLPAAAWGEKEGTFINSERRIGLIKRVAQAPGVALADFYIFKLLAEAWGCGDLFKAWSSPEATFQILKRCSAGMPCDITGIDDYVMLDRHGGIQWPFPTGSTLDSNERRLFEDGRFYTADEKAKFLFEAPRPLPEPISEDYPFVLLTGRSTSAQWHTQTRTQKSAVLRKLHPAEVYVEINPQDAQRLQIGPNEWVCVASRRGKIKARAVLIPTVQVGHVFMPMHYSETNKLTYPAFDPYSSQPSYKHCAVTLSRGE